MRPERFLGDSLKCLRDFPDSPRHDAGYQLDKVQGGDQPDDGAYRVSYFARRADAVYVLHAFHKKTTHAEEGS
jgi:phage-related protein